MPPREGQSAFMTLPSTLALMKVAADVGGRVESKWGGPGLWGRWAKPAQFICFCCISSLDLQTREGNDTEAGNSCRLCPCLSLVLCTAYLNIRKLVTNLFLLSPKSGVVRQTTFLSSSHTRVTSNKSCREGIPVSEWLVSVSWKHSTSCAYNP